MLRVRPSGRQPDPQRAYSEEIAGSKGELAAALDLDPPMENKSGSE